VVQKPRLTQPQNSCHRSHNAGGAIYQEAIDHPLIRSLPKRLPHTTGTTSKDKFIESVKVILLNKQSMDG
jgi:hypothetical protein